MYEDKCSGVGLWDYSEVEGKWGSGGIRTNSAAAGGIGAIQEIIHHYGHSQSHEELSMFIRLKGWEILRQNFEHVKIASPHIPSLQTTHSQERSS